MLCFGLSNTPGSPPHQRLPSPNPTPNLAPHPLLVVFRAYLKTQKLATNEWIPSSNVLEGVVILTRNPELDDRPATAKEDSKGAKD